MKRSIYLTLSGLSVLLVLVYVNHQDSIHEPLNPKQRYDLKTAAGLKAYQFDQKVERRAKDDHKNNRYDSPDLAMELEVELRSEMGQPFSYSGSYRFSAQRAAYANNQTASRTREILPWVERGPGNVGGRTRALLIHPDSNDVWIAGAVGGGIWKTENAGLSWRAVADDLPILSVTALAMCDSQPNVMYAGTGEGFYNFDAIIGDGLFKSVDGGESWEQVLSTVNQPEFKYVNRIIVSPTDPDLVLVATNTGIERSDDGGASWTEVYQPSGRTQQIIANPQNFLTQYATVNGVGVVKSIDAGLNWSPTGSVTAGFARIEMAIAPSDTAILYASFVGSGSSLYGFYRSDDAGASWSNLGNSPNWLGSQGWYDNTLVVSPFDANEIIVGGLDLYRIIVNSHTMSATKLTNWYAGAGYPYVHADQHMLLTIPGTGGNYSLLAGNDGGVFFSNDNGVTWSQRDDGYNVTQFYDADKHPAIQEFIGGTQDNGTNLSPNNATSSSAWDEAIGGDGFECSWNKHDGNIVYGSLYYSRLYKSTDGGNSFQSVGNGLPQSNVFYTSIGMDPRDSDVLLVVGDNNTLNRTADGGATWEIISGDFANTSRKIFQFSSVNSNIVWAASTSFGINVSTDHGRHFQLVNPPATAPGGYVLGIATHPDLENSAFITFGVSGGPKIFRTDDLGQSWTDITGNLPNVPVHTLIVLPFDTSRFWIGTDIGLFESPDNGATWAYANSGIPAVAIKKLKIVGQEIVAATHGRGIWSVHLDELPPLEVPILSPILAQLPPPPPNYPLVRINFSTRSAHDSIQVIANDSVIARFGPTPAYSDRMASFTGTYGNEVGVTVIGFSAGVAYTSDGRSLPIFAPRTAYEESFDSLGVQMTGDLMVGSDPNFSTNVLQTLHPYSSGQNYYAYIGPPILIDQTSSMTYRDVALVEPGDPGTSYPDLAMWDFVTVEGSLNGTDWQILIEPYDSRYDGDWTQYYNANSDATEALLRDHSINLGDFYATGDTVSLRFRLFADEYVTGWGWAIDDLEISSSTATTNFVALPTQYALLPNYPNPFNASTTIRFTLGHSGKIDLAIYDLLGRKVTKLLVGERMQAGPTYSLKWNGTDGRGQNVASGLYYLRLSYDGGEVFRKLTLLK